MLESRVDTFYQHHGITRPADISLLWWEEIVHVDVLYRPGQTDAATIGHQRVVFMDAHKPLAVRRAELAHEIGHALLHAGNQLTMSNGWSWSWRKCFVCRCPLWQQGWIYCKDGWTLSAVSAWRK